MVLEHVSTDSICFERFVTRVKNNKKTQQEMSCVYVLSCEHDKFYVGRTIDVLARFNAHKHGFGSMWCRAHPAKAIVELLSDLPFLELTTTLQYMSKFGIENVRGGPWCALTLSQGDMDTIQRFLHSEGFARKIPTEEPEEERVEEPLRKGKPWTPEEDAKLLTELAQSVALDTISSSHGRSEGAIRARAALHAKRLQESGLSPEAIAAQLHMTLKDVHQCLYGRRGPDLSRS
jgi:hypothetical protein